MVYFFIFVSEYGLIISFKISGNHAAALALAAKLRGIPAYIVIPKNAPHCKMENVVRYGGQVILSEATMQSREETASKVLQETGAVLIHPFNDGRIIRYCVWLLVCLHAHFLKSKL